MRDTRKIEADVNNPRLRRMFPRGNSMAALFKVLLFTLLMHTACTSLRFTATLDAIHAGASSFEVGLMLASISFGPMFLAIAAGRWLDRSGPRAPMLASRLSVMAAAGCAILLPASDLGIAPIFGACVLTGLSFMLTNVVIQRLTGDVTTPKNRRFAFTALSLTTASSNLAAPVVAGYVIERLSYTAVYVWSAVAPLILSVLLFVPAFGIVMKARPRAVSLLARTEIAMVRRETSSSISYTASFPAAASGQSVSKLLLVKFLLFWGFCQLRRLFFFPVIQQGHNLFFHFGGSDLLAKILFQFRSRNNHASILLFLF